MGLAVTKVPCPLSEDAACTRRAIVPVRLPSVLGDSADLAQELLVAGIPSDAVRQARDDDRRWSPSADG